MAESSSGDFTVGKIHRGPASAMFGNYATGGAINFRLWRGDQINGARYGVEGGSFGYLNNYAIVGGRNESLEGTAFMSDVRRRLYQPQLVQHPDLKRARNLFRDSR